LRLKGIDRAIVDRVLDDRRTPDAEADDAAVVEPDRVAADRLIDKHRRTLQRIADPRQRRERAYALLARNGFDPETCREVARRVAADEELDPAFPA
jgi:SOS response regulatory protein OraA/RecX